MKRVNNNNNNANEPPVVHRKIAVLGFRAVGKSSLTYAFVSGTFSDNYDPTIENTHHKTIRFRKVHFETDIVDTAGMDEYSRLSRNASVGVNGYVLVFSICSRQSFEGLTHINDSLLNTLGDATDCPRVIVGSMRDLTEQREVSHQVSLSIYVCLVWRSWPWVTSAPWDALMIKSFLLIMFELILFIKPVPS
jgi:Ras family protein